MLTSLILAAAMTGQFFDYGPAFGAGVDFQLSIGRPRARVWSPYPAMVYAGWPVIQVAPAQSWAIPGPVYAWYPVYYDNRRVIVWGYRLPDGTIWSDAGALANQQALRRPQGTISPEAGP
jgi:hypothetical protein